MKEFVNIRSNEELQNDLARVKEILGINPNIYGSDPKAIKESLKFIIEFNHLIIEQFKTNYGQLTQEYIKRKVFK